MTDTLTELAIAGRLSHDDAERLIWLDAYQEEHGETGYVRACREFYAKCLEPRRYKKYHHTGDPVTGDEGSWDHRRALPGWREWLGMGGVWFRLTEKSHKEHEPPLQQLRNWHHLVPSLWSLLGGSDRWRRKGKRIELRLRGPRTESREGTGHYQNCHVDLDFERGWLARVEFRSWRDADALLPAILADQPFVEAGIRGAVMEGVRYRGTDLTGAGILRVDAGPAFDLIDTALMNSSAASFSPGPRNDAAALRARSALSAALIARARSLPVEARP